MSTKFHWQKMKEDKKKYNFIIILSKINNNKDKIWQIKKIERRWNFLKYNFINYLK